MRVIAYLRCSTLEQAERFGLPAQEHRIRQACEHRNLELVDVVRDEGRSGKDLERPGLWTALTRIRAGEADGLIVAKLDRLTRSVHDFAELLEWFQRAKASLIILDPELDTSSPTGRAMAQMVAVFAEWERGVIGERTRDGLVQARLAGRGRARVVDDPVAQKILELRRLGYSQSGIASLLNAEGVPTVRGGERWRQSSVQGVLGYRRTPSRRRVRLPE